jgi:hypothetical protein
VGPASVRGTASFRPHLVVIPYCFENGGEHASGGAWLSPQPVQHELRDGSIPDHIGSAQHLKVPGYGRLGQVENGLQVGHKQRRGRQAVQNPEPGGLGNGQQKVGSGRCWHIRGNEYKRLAKDGKDARVGPPQIRHWHSAPGSDEPFRTLQCAAP